MTIKNIALSTNYSLKSKTTNNTAKNLSFGSNPDKYPEISECHPMPSMANTSNYLRYLKEMELKYPNEVKFAKAEIKKNEAEIKQNESIFIRLPDKGLGILSSILNKDEKGLAAALEDASKELEPTDRKFLENIVSKARRNYSNLPNTQQKSLHDGLLKRLTNPNGSLNLKLNPSMACMIYGIIACFGLLDQPALGIHASGLPILGLLLLFFARMYIKGGRAGGVPQCDGSKNPIGDQIFGLMMGLGGLA